MAKKYSLFKKEGTDKYEYIVNDELINATDAEIDETIPFAGSGTIIRLANASIAKSKEIDGTWSTIS